MALNLGEVTFGLGADASGLDAASRALKNFGDQVDATSRKVTTANNSMASSFKLINSGISLAKEGLAAFGIALSVQAIIGYSVKALEAAAAIKSLAEELQISTDTLQVWQFAARETSVSQDKLTASLDTFERNVAKVSEGVKANVETFNRWGVFTEDAQGKTLSFSDILQQAAVVIANIQDPLKQTAAGVELFGKSFLQASPAIIQMGKDLQGTQTLAEKFGQVMSKDTIDAADRMSTRFAILGIEMQNAWTGMLAGLDSFLLGYQTRLQNFKDWWNKEWGGPAGAYAGPPITAPAPPKANMPRGTEFTGQALQPINWGVMNPPANDPAAANAQERLNTALQAAADKIQAAAKEYTALTKGAEAYAKAVEDTAIVNAVNTMVTSLVKLGDTTEDAKSKGEELRKNLLAVAALKPYVQIAIGIEQLQVKTDDLTRGTDNYLEQLHILKALGSEALAKINEQLGIQTTNVTETARAWSDLIEKEQAFTKARSEITNTKQSMEDLWRQTELVTTGYAKYIQYLKNPAAYDALNKELEAMRLLGTYTEAQIDAERRRGVATINTNNAALESYQRTAAEINSITSALDTAFQQVGSTIVNAFKTGKIEAQSFLDIVSNLLEAIINAVIEATIIKPIVASISGGLTSVLGAKGLVLQGGSVTAMAKGDVLYGPTFLAGGAALASEYGQAEAVMPLKRTSSGDLGVSAAGMGGNPVNVYVTNNASPDANVQVKTSKDGRGEINLEVLITKAVSRSIKQGGDVYKSIGTMFDAPNRVSQR